MEKLNTNQEQEFGVVLYEKSNAKHALDAPTGKVGAKGWAQRIYMLLLCVALLGWFLYSVITAANDPEIGIAKAIVNHIASFIVLVIALFILVLTAFNAWGKFSRAALKHKVLTRQRGMEGVQTRQLESDLAEADANKSNEYALRIYKDLVVVVNEGETTLIHRSEIQRVKGNQVPRGYQLTFELYDDESVLAQIPVPIADLPRVKKHFDNFEYTPASREKGYFKKKLPMLAFMLVPLLIGVAILVVRSLVLPDIPLIIGAAFLAFGVLLMLAQFGDTAVIGNGIMLICTGLVLIGLPIAIAVTIVDLVEELTIMSLLTTFTPLHAGLSVFFGFGPMLIIIGIAGLVDCARM